MPTAISSGVTAGDALVVDASAIISLLIDPGPAGEAIGARLVDAHLVAPAILPFEVANVLRRRRNQGLLSRSDAAQALDTIALLSIELWPWEPLAERAWDLGDNLSSYDASYVALAEQIEATLLTRDARIARAPGVSCAVEVV